MPRGDTLWRRLEAATEPELRNIAAIVGLADGAAKRRDVLVEEVSAGLRAASGHSLANLFRGPHDFPYKRLLIDAANKLAPGWTILSRTSFRLRDGRSEEQVEDAAWAYFEARAAAAVETLSPEARADLRARTEAELRRLGYAEAVVLQVGAGIAGGAAGSLVGPALAYHVALSGASGLAWLKLWLAGKVGVAAALGAGGAVMAALYGPVFVWWAWGPAYRKTVPAALHLVQVRKLRELEATLVAG